VTRCSLLGRCQCVGLTCGLHLKLKLLISRWRQKIPSTKKYHVQNYSFASSHPRRLSRRQLGKIFSCYNKNFAFCALKVPLLCSVSEHNTTGQNRSIDLYEIYVLDQIPNLDLTITSRAIMGWLLAPAGRFRYSVCLSTESKRIQLQKPVLLSLAWMISNKRKNCFVTSII
jgi:hypothetical protein